MATIIIASIDRDNPVERNERSDVMDYVSTIAIETFNNFEGEIPTWSIIDGIVYEILSSLSTDAIFAIAKNMSESLEYDCTYLHHEVIPYYNEHCKGRSF